MYVQREKCSIIFLQFTYIVLLCKQYILKEQISHVLSQYNVKKLHDQLLTEKKRTSEQF